MDEDERLCYVRWEVQVRKKKECNKTHIMGLEFLLLYYDNQEKCEIQDVGRKRSEFILGCIES